MHTFALKPKATQQATSDKTTIPGRGHFGQSPEVSSILDLHRTNGHQAVQRTLQTDAGQSEAELTEPASPSFGHDFSRVPMLLLRQRAIGNEAMRGLLRYESQRAESLTESTSAGHQMQEANRGRIASSVVAPNVFWNFSKIPLLAPDRPSGPKRDPRSSSES